MAVSCSCADCSASFVWTARGRRPSRCPTYSAKEREARDRICKICSAPFFSIRYRRCCSAACMRENQRRFQHARFQRTKSKHPLSAPQRKCDNCARTLPVSRFRRYGDICADCRRYSHAYVRQCRRSGRQPLAFDVWLVRRRERIERRGEAIPAGFGRCPKCLSLFRTAAPTRRIRYRPCRACRRGEPGRKCAREERWAAMRSQPHPEREVRKARREAIAAWKGWLLRAPAWWLEERARSLRELKNEAFRRSYWRNLKKERARIQRYKHAHPDRKSLWGERRAERARALSDGSVTQSAVAAILASRQRCPYCVRSLDVHGRSLDHVIPLCEGGWHSTGNLTVCCASCQVRKGRRRFSAWLEFLTPAGRRSATSLYERLYGAEPSQAPLSLRPDAISRNLAQQKLRKSKVLVRSRNGTGAIGAARAQTQAGKSVSVSGT